MGNGEWGDKETRGKGRSPMPNAPCPMPHAQCPMTHAPRKVITQLVSSALTLAVNWISAEGHPFFNLDALLVCVSSPLRVKIADNTDEA
ncbi:hypothetical protein [Tolypothrix sp. VBCCA 56010]|uniref:hypothetical protein n=1 Tax=Tolypothrix sp. VBCCA 56010 TaxID=3137731 RepID=UPI003D7EB00E